MKPVSLSEPSSPLWRSILTALLIYSVILAAGAFLYACRSVLWPFVLALILAYVLNPLVSLLEREGVRRSVSVAIVYLLLSAVISLFLLWAFLLFWDEIPRLRAQFPAHVAKVKALALNVESFLEAQWPWLRKRPLLEEGSAALTHFVEREARRMPLFLTSAASVIMHLALAPFVGYFALKGGAGLLSKTVDLCPGRWVEKFLSLFYEIDAALENYLRGVFIESAAIGVLSVGGLMALGVDQAVLIGTLAGVTNVIPYLGPFVGAGAGVVAAFLQTGSLSAMGQVILLFTVIHFIDGWVLQPVIMKRSLDLHPALLLFALLCGGELGGIPGLILAVPVACALIEIFKIVSQWSMAEYGLRSVPKEIVECAAKPWVV